MIISFILILFTVNASSINCINKQKWENQLLACTKKIIVVAYL